MPKNTAKTKKNNADVELREFLVHSFTKIDRKFDNIDSQFTEIKKELTGKADKADIERILNRLTMTNNKIDDFRGDQIGMQRQLERQKEINIKIAQKVGIDLFTD